MRNPTVWLPLGFPQNHQCFNGFTYRKVKSKMKAYLSQSYTGEVLIYRERKGEWGEWFEYWQLVNGKPTIIKQGWM